MRRKPRASVHYASSSPNGVALLSGWLLKRTKKGKWQARFFEMHSHYLLYQVHGHHDTLYKREVLVVQYDGYSRT